MYKTLIDCHTLALHIHDPQWVVVDCRFTLSDTAAGRRAYEASHIEGARYAHLDDDLSSPVTPQSGRHPLPDPHRLAAKLGEWGIDNSKQVVVYDDSFGAMASRLWWLLRWLGHDAVALLDCGLARWQRTAQRGTALAQVKHLGAVGGGAEETLRQRVFVAHRQPEAAHEILKVRDLRVLFINLLIMLNQFFSTGALKKVVIAGIGVYGFVVYMRNAVDAGI